MITTGIAAVAALAESLGLVATLSTLTAGGSGRRVHLRLPRMGRGGGPAVRDLRGAGLVHGRGHVLAHAFGRTVLPTFKYSRAANIPGRKPTRPIELEWAEPGVKMGQ